MSTATNEHQKPTTDEFRTGFDRTFGARPDRATGRRRYMLDPGTGQLVELGEDWEPTTRRVPVVGDAHYDNLRATDGTPINSRTRHREYMKSKGLTVASDFEQTWAKAAEQRARAATGDFDHKARREAIERAIVATPKTARRGPYIPEVDD